MTTVESVADLTARRRAKRGACLRVEIVPGHLNRLSFVGATSAFIVPST